MKFKQTIFFFSLLFIISSLYATSSPKQDSPARFMQSLGTIAQCCNEMKELLEKSREEFPSIELLKKRSRSNSFIEANSECPLYRAIVLRSEKIIHLCSSPLVVNFQDERTKKTALHAACGLFNEKEEHTSDAELHLKYLIIKALLILGFDPNAKDYQDKKPMDYLNTPGHDGQVWQLNSIALLLKSGAAQDF